MENDRALWIAGLVVAGLLALALAFVLVVWIFTGAAILLGIAAAQGFVGLIAYVAAWVFLLPFMLIASAVTGAFATWAGDADYREARATEKREKEAARKRRRSPAGRSDAETSRRARKVPGDPMQRYLWANRLPPYDRDDD